MKPWPRKYAHSSFSFLVQSLLPKDTLLRTYLFESNGCYGNTNGRQNRP